MNIAKCLECDLCNLILEKPITLPCGNTLCQHHLEETDELKFSCMFCLEEHQVPKNGFKISDRLSFMINFQIELNPLKKQIKESFNKLKQSIQEYEDIHPDGFLYDYFAEIFNKVDLHREELLKEINERYEEIIKQLKDKQEKCKLNLKNVEKINLNELKNEIIPHFQLKLRISDIHLEDLNDIYSKMSVHLKKTQFETKKLKNDLLLGEAISFEKHEKNSSFGDLILKNFDFVLSNECGKLIRSYEKQSRANFFHIDAKSNRLLIASNDRTIKICDLETGIIKILNNFQSVNCLLVIPNNKFISVSSDATIKIWDLESNECLNTLRNDLNVSALCSISYNQIAFGHENGSISIFELNNNSLTKVKFFKAHTFSIRCLLSFDKTRLISSYDSEIKMWNLETFECINVFEGHTDTIRYLELTSDGYLLSCSFDRTVKLWQIQTGKMLQSINLDCSVYCVKVLNEDLFAVGLQNGVIEIYEMDELKKVITIAAHSSPESFILRLSLLSDGNLVSVSGDGEIKLLKVFDSNIYH
jgi:hypothetical protein